MQPDQIEHLLALVERYVVTREEEIDILRNSNVAMTNILGDTTANQAEFMRRAFGDEGE